MLIVDLLKKKFHAYISPLRFQTEKLIDNAINLAISIEFEIRDEDKLRFSLMDRDLDGRDVISIISEN